MRSSFRLLTDEVPRLLYVDDDLHEISPSSRGKSPHGEDLTNTFCPISYYIYMFCNGYGYNLKWKKKWVLYVNDNLHEVYHISVGAGVMWMAEVTGSRVTVAT